MKKCFSLILTLAMMLSMVPAAGAAEVPEAAEPEIAVEEITSREDLAREIESAQLADAAKLTDEEIAALEETRHARLEALFADLECAEVTEDGMMPLPEAVALNAAATDFTLTVQGKGCHGAHPEQGVDAIVVSAQIVTALQSVVSRGIAPTASGVVTIGTIHGGTKENIIADSVTMTGTIRALNPETQEHLKSSVRAIAENTAAAWGATAELVMDDLCPALINDDALVEKLYGQARELLGPERAILMREPSLGADDFAFFSNRVPGCYFNVGARTDGMPGQALHSPTFVPHEDCMETALLLLLQAASRR